MPSFIKLSFRLSFFLRSKIWPQLKFHKPHAVFIVCANWKQSAWRLWGHLLCLEFSSGALLQKCLNRGWNVALGEAALEFMLQKDYFLILHPLYCHFFLDEIKLPWTRRSIHDRENLTEGSDSVQECGWNSSAKWNSGRPQWEPSSAVQYWLTLPTLLLFVCPSLCFLGCLPK